MNNNIGIIGCGTLGSSLAQQFYRQNISLYLSISGSSNSYQRIVSYGMKDMLVDNKTICKKADIIFIGIRPQQFSQIADLEISPDKTIISLMSTIRTEQLKHHFKHNNVTRVMTTIPELNQANLGIAGIFGDDTTLAANLMRLINIKPFMLRLEASIDIFTVLVNLPYLISVGNTQSVAELKKYLNILLKNDKINTQEMFEWANKAYAASVSCKVFAPDSLALSATKDGILAEIIRASHTTKSLVDIFKIALNKIDIIRGKL